MLSENQQIASMYIHYISLHDLRKRFALKRALNCFVRWIIVCIFSYRIFQNLYFWDITNILGEFLHNLQTLFLILHPEVSIYIILIQTPWILKCVFFMYSNSVPTWQRPHCMLITNKILLIWRSEIIGVFVRISGNTETHFVGKQK